MEALSQEQSKNPISSGQKEFGHHGLRTVWKDLDSLERLSSTGQLLHHFQRAFNGLVVTALTSLVSIITIGLALFVLAAVLFVMENLSSVARGVESSLSMHLYLNDQVSPAESGMLMDEISKVSGVAAVSYVSRDDALLDLKKFMADEAVLLEGLDADNPLPASIQVSFESSSHAQQVFREIEQRYSNHPAFEYIQFSRSVIEDLVNNLKRVRRGAMLGLLLVLLMTAFIISNTIQLALYSRRQEIEIMRLVGATEDFIRMPFLIEGFLQGFCGALCAIGLLYFARAGLTEFASKVEFLKMLHFETSFLSLSSVCLVILVGVLVGVAGSYYAVRRFSLR